MSTVAILVRNIIVKITILFCSVPHIRLVLQTTNAAWGEKAWVRG